MRTYGLNLHARDSGLLAAVLAGSVLGALAAKPLLTHEVLTAGYRLSLTSGSVLRRIPIAAFFPMMLLLADLIQKKAVFLFAFFCRGAASAYVLCVCLSCLPAEPSFTEAVFLRCLLPLPIDFYCAGLLSQPACSLQGRSRFLLILLAFTAELLALLPELLMLK